MYTRSDICRQLVSSHIAIPSDKTGAVVTTWTQLTVMIDRVRNLEVLMKYVLEDELSDCTIMRTLSS